MGVGECQSRKSECGRGAVELTSDGGRTFHVVLRAGSPGLRVQTLGRRRDCAGSRGRPGAPSTAGGPGSPGRAARRRARGRSWANARVRFATLLRAPAASRCSSRATRAAPGSGGSAPCNADADALLDFATPRVGWLVCGGSRERATRRRRSTARGTPGRRGRRPPPPNRWTTRRSAASRRRLSRRDRVRAGGFGLTRARAAARCMSPATAGGLAPEAASRGRRRRLRPAVRPRLRQHRLRPARSRRRTADATDRDAELRPNLVKSCVAGAAELRGSRTVEEARVVRLPRGRGCPESGDGSPASARATASALASPSTRKSSSCVVLRRGSVSVMQSTNGSRPACTRPRRDRWRRASGSSGRATRRGHPGRGQAGRGRRCRRP